VNPLAGFIAAQPLAVFAVLCSTLLGLAALSWALIRHLRRSHFFNRREWLWYLCFGFFTLLATLSLFLQLADEMGLGRSLGRFDEDLADELALRLQPGTLRAFALLTHLGDSWTLTALCVIVALLLLNRGERRLAVAWIIALAGNGLLNRALKELFQRSRPLHEHGWTYAEGWSFPSGHSSGSLVAYGMLAWLLMRFTPRAAHLPLMLAAIGLALLVGYSRIVLQVHWFSDVLAGFALGASWLAICITGAELARLRGSGPGEPTKSPP